MRKTKKLLKKVASATFLFCGYMLIHFSQKVEMQGHLKYNIIGVKLEILN